MKNTRNRKTKTPSPEEWAKDFKQMAALYAYAFGIVLPTPGSILRNHSARGINHHRNQEIQSMLTDNTSDPTAQHRDLFDSNVRRSPPNVGTVDASENVSRQLLDGIVAQSSVEEMSDH